MNSTQKLNTREAAKYLGLKPGTLEVWRCKGVGPSYCKLGRRVVYDLADLDAYVFDRKVLTVDTFQMRSGHQRGA